ncbi:MAG TPA: hypothetical protein PLB21_13350 [Actinomycetota bacterium]|nr:hypothetical protein [Actinomycetota bacterium]
MTRGPGPDWGASTVERASRFARSVACAVTVGLVALMLAAATPAGAAVDPLNPSSWACGSEDLGLGDDRVELAPVSPGEREADGGPIVPRATPSGAWVPVVMVHGWTARSTHPNADGTEDTQGTFSHLIDFTANRSGSADVGRSLVGQLQGLPGAAVFTFDYHPYSGRWVTDEHLGPALVKVVDCLAKASGQKVIVVGHSMGGLVGRFAATDGGRGSDSIAQLVTMGTPNQGSLAAMVTAAAADVGAVVDRRLAVLRLLLAECGRVTSSSMDGASLCHMLPAFVTAFDGEAGKALRFGSQELKSLNARPVPSDITINALAGSTLMSVPRMGWFGWSWETDTVDIGDVVVDHASATKPSSTIDDISCAYQMSPVRGLADTAGLVLKVRTLNEVGDVPWNLLSGPCFHNALPRSIELTNAVMALVREEIDGRPGVLRDARSCGAIDPGFAIEGVTDNPAVETARAIYDAAVACDSEALTRLAVRDQTELSLGVMTVDEAFAIPNSHDRYWAITRMLSLPPYVHSDNISWPYRDEDTGEVDWDGPDASGQLSTQDLRRLEEGFWSLSIRYDGTWAGMFQGD